MVYMAGYTAVVKGDYLQGRVSDMVTTCISPVGIHTKSTRHCSL